MTAPNPSQPGTVFRSSDVTATTATTFKELYIDGDLCNALSAAGYERPSPVQEAVLPLSLSGADLIVQATSGTGKTVVISCACLNQARNASSTDQTTVCPCVLSQLHADLMLLHRRSCRPSPPVQHMSFFTFCIVP